MGRILVAIPPEKAGFLGLQIVLLFAGYLAPPAPDATRGIYEDSFHHLY
jgi:hypothetical protein